MESSCIDKREIVENSATIDRIENLPDDVLGRILSFLPIKLAVNTMLLSKRWAPLCRSLSVLCFDDKDVEDEDEDSLIRFCWFVDALMLSPRVGHKPIKTFHLKCNSTFWNDDNIWNDDDINRLVETAIQHHVEDLDLSMAHDKFTLAPNIFTCSTLIVLKLKNLRVKGNILSVEFPLLKTLHLEDVTLQHKQDLQKLISGAPLLHDLHTRMYYKKGGDVRPEGFKPSSKLVKADVNIFDTPFNAIYNVKFLRVFKIWEPHVDAKMNAYYKALPIFGNLIHLKLEFYCFRHGWNDIMKMLHHCPKLQVLSIIKGREIVKCFNKYWKYANHVPECVASHLRSCTISSICFSEYDLQFVAYILQKATLLQFMTIKIWDYFNPKQVQQISDQLSPYLKISSGCKLEFSCLDHPI